MIYCNNCLILPKPFFGNCWVRRFGLTRNSSFFKFITENTWNYTNCTNPDIFVQPQKKNLGKRITESSTSWNATRHITKVLFSKTGAKFTSSSRRASLYATEWWTMEVSLRFSVCCIAFTFAQTATQQKQQKLRPSQEISEALSEFFCFQIPT